MQSLEILKQELITQKKLLDEKGFPVDVKNVNPSPSEITKAIENISLDFSQSDAVESDVVAGKTFYSKNTELKTGTLELPDFESATATENTVLAGKTFYAGDTILKTGTAKIPDLSTTTATESDVLSGKEFFNASGEKVVGKYASKAPKIADRSVTELTTSDLQGATEIGDYAFYYCKKLTSVDIPDGVTRINEKAFGECTALVNVTIPDSVGSTGLGSFYGARKLENVSIKETSTLTSFAQNVFYNCASLKSIFIPKNVAYINDYSFGNCTALETVIFAHGVILNTLPTSAFSSCRSLKNLTLRNIKISIQIGSGSSWGHLLTLDSLLNTIKELWDNTGNVLGATRKLTMGSANTAKLADIYVKLIDITDEMRAEDQYIDNKAPFVQCESADEGAMLITEYVTTVKNWQLA